MREYDEFAAVFRTWSHMLGGMIGFLLGIFQYAIGAHFLVIAISLVLGVTAGEVAFRLGEKDQRAPLGLGQKLGPIVSFLSASAFTGGVVFLSHKSGLGIASGAVVLVMSIVIAGEFLGGRAAAAGVIIAGINSTLYWLIPPYDSFLITDAHGFAELIVVSLACFGTFGMLKLVCSLNR